MQLQDLKALKDILDERWQVETDYLTRKTLLDDMIRVSKEIVKLIESKSQKQKMPGQEI